MEHEGKSSTEQVTALIVFEVKPERMNDFEEWVKGINQVVKGFEGYMGADIIRPRDHAHPENVIVLRFDQYDHLRAWMGSLQREEWLKKSEEMMVSELQIDEAHGSIHGLPSRIRFTPRSYLPSTKWHYSQSWHSICHSLHSVRYSHPFFVAGRELCLSCSPCSS